MKELPLDLYSMNIGLAHEGGVMSPIDGDGDDDGEIKNDYI